MRVIKRNGDYEDFHPYKIYNAISKAFLSVTNDIDKIDEDCIDKIMNHFDAMSKSDKAEDISVEEIQDIVEKKLMASSHKDVARAYIRYRYLHELGRDEYTMLITGVKEKLNAENVQNQNANVDEHSFGGRMGEATRVITKHYALNYLLSPMARENHLNNEIYIHDLDNYAVGNHNCLSIPFDDLLANGFKTRQTDIRPAQSVATAFQLIAVIFQIQSLQQFGGVSATHLDWTMVPYVRKSFNRHYNDAIDIFYDSLEEFNEYTVEDNTTSIDDNKVYDRPRAYAYAWKMTKREVHQAVEGMYHNLNTLQSRSGNQLPFTSINYGTCTLREGRMITRALLDTSIDGIGKKHRTPIFPCGIFQMKTGVNRKPGDPNYDLYRLALKSTSLRLYPNYANVDWSVNAGYDENDPCTYFSTMGCRTTNGMDINGLGQRKDGRGNICPVTIILPTLAMEAKERFMNEYDDTVVEVFMDFLEQKIDEAKDMLIERFDYICSQDPQSARFMYENNTMAGYIPEEGIRSALKHGTLVIGQIGLAEALQILIGCDHTTIDGMCLATDIEELFARKCAEFKKEYSLNFGVYYSPAENLCYTAMQKFKEKYGEIPNVSDREYFTNSIHVPVWKNLTPFEKIDVESMLTGYSNAGCITYVEIDTHAEQNIDALETIVNYAMDHDIPYFAINIPNDQCQTCGHISLIENTCPVCGGDDIRRLRRVTGYLTGDYREAFNYGKQKEVEDRVTHAVFERGDSDC